MVLHHVRQMQGYLLDEIGVAAHQPIELRAVRQGREGIAQTAARVTVEIPFAGETGPSGEDGEGDDLTGAHGCIGSRRLSFSRAGLAKVVHHDVECGEEGVHVEHEESQFLSLRDRYWASQLYRPWAPYPQILDA